MQPRLIVEMCLYQNVLFVFFCNKLQKRTYTYITLQFPAKINTKTIVVGVLAQYGCRRIIQVDASHWW